MTTPADATPPTAADPLDVLSEEDHATLDAVIAASMADDAVANHARRIVRDLCERLASAEQAKADAEARLAKAREALSAAQPFLLPDVYRGLGSEEWTRTMTKVAWAIGTAALGGTDAGGGEGEARC